MQTALGRPELETEVERLWNCIEDEAVLQCVADFGLDGRGRLVLADRELHSSWRAETTRRLPGRSDRSIHARWWSLQETRWWRGQATPLRQPETTPWIAPSPPTHWSADTSFSGGLNGGHHPGWKPVWVVSMVVPANWRPGRRMATTLQGGVRVIITPPDDAIPGMALKCRVPASDPASMTEPSPRIYLRDAESTPESSSASSRRTKLSRSAEWGQLHPSSSKTTDLSVRNYPIPSARCSVRSRSGTMERPARAFDAAKQGAGARARAVAAMEKSAEVAPAGKNAKLVALSAQAIAEDRGADEGALCGARHVRQLLPARACPTCGLARSYSQHSLPSICTDCLRAVRVQARCRAVPGVRHPLLKPKVARDQIAPAHDTAVISPWPAQADDSQRAQNESAGPVAYGAPQAKRQRSEASPGTAGGLLRGKHMKAFQDWEKAKRLSAIRHLPRPM